ncbi:hypothetical protein I7I53_08854 [Histoplasma capsulatum var. duboisii H88]|uniref:Uncharacterized protein n=1 Tax=Ajellomyces capsulatus (strain H88) TaxID=544711 RepID=A0A8A1L7P3_AJEC8|nr:hypothetical protein I7I53_08854 [Histoplasma capsulatum var. duboisii H88]
MAKRPWKNSTIMRQCNDRMKRREYEIETMAIIQLFFFMRWQVLRPKTISRTRNTHVGIRELVKIEQQQQKPNLTKENGSAVSRKASPLDETEGRGRDMKYEKTQSEQKRKLRTQFTKRHIPILKLFFLKKTKTKKEEKKKKKRKRSI